MNAYLPILILGAIAAAFAVGSVGIALVIGPRRYNRAKLEAYECGIEPVTPAPAAADRTRFPVKYYLAAMLFIVFDIEIVFLYPWAVASTTSACSRWWRWCCSCSRSSSPTRTCGGAAD